MVYPQYNELKQSNYEDIVSFYDKDGMGLTSETQWRKLGFNNYLEWFFSKWLGMKRDHREKKGEKTVESDPFDNMLRETGFL